MEEFLRDYIEMIAEARDQDINSEQLKNAVDFIKNNDEIWETFDNYIGIVLDDEGILNNKEEGEE